MTTPLESQALETAARLKDERDTERKRNAQLRQRNRELWRDNLRLAAISRRVVVLPWKGYIS